MRLFALELLQHYTPITKQARLYSHHISAFKDGVLCVGSDKLIQGYPAHIPAPVLVSKQGDNLYLEWHGVGNPSLDIDLRSLEAWFHAFNAQGDDVEADFTLDTADGR